jgi:hypothetical protein
MSLLGPTQPTRAIGFFENNEEDESERNARKTNIRKLSLNWWQRLLKYEMEGSGWRGVVPLTQLDALPGGLANVFLWGCFIIPGATLLIQFENEYAPSKGLGTAQYGGTFYSLLLIFYVVNFVSILVQRNTLLVNSQIRYQHNQLKRVKPKIRRVTPAVTLGLSKDMHALFECLFGKFPSHSFMISYNWVDPELPRSLATLFPADVCWLDVNKLMPGTEITDACRAAASGASARFVFLTRQYLASVNCQSEFEAMRLEPERVMVFAYDEAYTAGHPTLG